MLLGDGRQIQSRVAKRTNQDVRELGCRYRTQGLLNETVPRHPPDDFMEFEVAPGELPEIVPIRSSLHTTQGPLHLAYIIRIRSSALAGELRGKTLEFYAELIDLPNVFSREIRDRCPFVWDPLHEALELKFLQSLAHNVLSHLHLLAQPALRDSFTGREITLQDRVPDSLQDLVLQAYGFDRSKALLSAHGSKSLIPDNR